ncbi:aspartic proteinase-like protein 2 [Tanacetum coccineum]
MLTRMELVVVFGSSADVIGLAGKRYVGYIVKSRIVNGSLIFGDGRKGIKKEGGMFIEMLQNNPELEPEVQPKPKSEPVPEPTIEQMVIDKELLYYAKVLLGTPPKEFSVQIDTSSDALWVSCKACTGCYQNTSHYDESVSSTSHLISCSETLCTKALTTCTNDRQAQCTYTLNHSSGTEASDYYVSDVIHLNINGTSHALPTVFFGCSTSVAQRQGRLDGVFGFGRQSFSVINQLYTQGVAPHVFSHCLAGSDSVTGGGILAIGYPQEPKIVYTPLVPDMINFDITLESISVDGQTLPINQSTFKQGRTRIDSGTTMAYLARGAYLHLLDADYLVQQPSQGDFDVWCIGFIESTNQDTTLGDLVLRDKLIVYDLEGERIGWSNYDCSLFINATATAPSSGVTSEPEILLTVLILLLHASFSMGHVISKKNEIGQYKGVATEELNVAIGNELRLSCVNDTPIFQELQNLLLYGGSFHSRSHQVAHSRSVVQGSSDLAHPWRWETPQLGSCVGWKRCLMEITLSRADEKHHVKNPLKLSFFPRTHVNEESIYRRASTYPSQLRIPAGGGTTNGLFALLTSIGRSLSATISILDLISKCKVELLFMIVPIEASYQLAHTGLKVADEHQITIKKIYSNNIVMHGDKPVYSEFRLMVAMSVKNGMILFLFNVDIIQNSRHVWLNIISWLTNLMKFAVDKYLSLIIITTYRLKGSINPLLKEADIDKDGKMSMYEFRSLLRSLIEHHTVASFDYSVDLLEERVKSFSSQRVSHNVKTLLLGPYMPAGPPNGSHKPSLHPALVNVIDTGASSREVLI